MKKLTDSKIDKRRKGQKEEPLSNFNDASKMIQIFFFFWKPYKPDFTHTKSQGSVLYPNTDLTQVKEKRNDSVTQVHMALVCQSRPLPAAF